MGPLPYLLVEYLGASDNGLSGTLHVNLLSLHCGGWSDHIDDIFTNAPELIEGGSLSATQFVARAKGPARGGARGLMSFAPPPRGVYKLSRCRSTFSLLCFLICVSFVFCFFCLFFFLFLCIDCIDFLIKRTGAKGPNTKQT